MLVLHRTRLERRLRPVLGGVLPRFRRIVDVERDVGDAVAVLPERLVERRFTAVRSIETK
jgi:hypothetical protein